MSTELTAQMSANDGTTILADDIAQDTTLQDMVRCPWLRGSKSEIVSDATIVPTRKISTYAVITKFGMDLVSDSDAAKALADAADLCQAYLAHGIVARVASDNE